MYEGKVVTIFQKESKSIGVGLPIFTIFVKIMFGYAKYCTLYEIGETKIFEVVDYCITV